MEQKELLVLLLKESKGIFNKVVPYNASTDRLLLMDFSGEHLCVDSSVLDDTGKFTEYVNNKLYNAQARYGIGGYNQQRTIYSRSAVFNVAGSQEPRRLHLGIDIWGKPLTKVMSPLDGIVHSFAFNSQFGDYGATIILSHQLKGISFHTLYGHLSAASIKNLHGGARIQKGDVFAEFGIPQENGSWPPHLHFQIIRDMQGMRGDYPGVCKLSERELYLKNCPDPDLILNMMQRNPC